MSKKQLLDTPASYRKEIATILKSLSHRHDTYRVFSDWVEMMALAFSNAVDKTQFDVREARYMQIVKEYDKEEVNSLCKMFGLLTLLMDKEPEDQMGHLFTEQELASSHLGQFFTPFSLSYMMAKMTFTDVEKVIQEYGFFSMCEPACGAGGMIVAAAKACQDQGVNYQRDMHVRAVDVDRRCVHMAYVQCSLLHIPAIIYRGNSLSMEFNEAWYTPAHILGGWSAKLRSREIDERDNGWWRATSPAERIDLLQKANLDLSAAFDRRPPLGVALLREPAETA